MCGRPISDKRRCPLGRETSIAEVVWIDDWPYLKDKGLEPPLEFEGYGDKLENKLYEYRFDDEKFKYDFMSLRRPAEYEILENGALRLYGRQSLMSNHHQNILVRRQTDFKFEAETCLEFNFNHFQKMAGLLYRYDELNQYFLRISYDENKGEKCLGILVINNGEFTMPIEEIPVGDGKIYLKLKVEFEKGKFFYSKDGLNWNEIPYDIDVTILSDEYANPLGFTGAFVGMCCIDMQDYSAYADYYYFKYESLE
ncbi:beta-xylosidase family glycoside hydrolase [Caloramator sp. Dgby_cultured_2]|uniref:beta-xylosidase family glycoside hydrolase n=1 Tax=Caloramator sp. Dgby_cultured_2 TaxID=3029174 RepID=UPI00237DF991|nr:hypothetical protein [Caloramator sp. Dgby_cultured_2]WDU83444.1 hypothetical protein PWK10_01770 [Caloramator sp. Dgby_cultured_2]